MKYAVLTFGCRVNQADSLAIEEQLRSTGCRPSPPEQADVIVVNTCSVTAGADQSARQAIRRAARHNPSARLVVTGCYATRRPDDVAQLPGVLRVIPNDEKHRLVAAALDADASTTAERFGDGPGSCGAAIEPGVAGRTAFTLRVQTGCAEPCAYCIIPTTRGAPRSSPPATVLTDVNRAISAGFREIALTGVHLGSYGRDLSPSSSLLALLRLLADLPGDVRFRISSLEPMDCGPAIIDLVAASDRFAPHFHLPLQHASDAVLVRMRRPYSAARYAALADAIRSRMADACLGSDVIVGFPGETDVDFERLLEYLQGSPLTHLHVFPYSDRPGTEASAMDGKVPGAVIRERTRRVREVADDLKSRFSASQVGTIHKGLTLEDGSVVVTGNYLKLRIPPGRERNQWVTVRVEDGMRASPVDAPQPAYPAGNMDDAFRAVGALTSAKKP